MAVAFASASGIGGSRAGCLQIVRDREIRTEVGKDQNTQRDPRLLDVELLVLQVALPLLQSDLRLDHIGVRHFAARFQLLRDVEELLGVAETGLRR